MNLQILWTPVALQSLAEVINYTYEQFGERQMFKLTSQISEAANRIATFPLSGKYEEELAETTGIEYRNTLVISEIKLLYTISGDTLFVEYVKNTRMDDATMLEIINKSGFYHP